MISEFQPTRRACSLTKECCSIRAFHCLRCTRFRVSSPLQGGICKAACSIPHCPRADTCIPPSFAAVCRPRRRFHLPRALFRLCCARNRQPGAGGCLPRGIRRIYSEAQAHIHSQSWFPLCRQGKVIHSSHFWTVTRFNMTTSLVGLH